MAFLRALKTDFTLALARLLLLLCGLFLYDVFRGIVPQCLAISHDTENTPKNVYLRPSFDILACHAIVIHIISCYDLAGAGAYSFG